MRSAVLTAPARWWRRRRRRQSAPGLSAIAGFDPNSCAGPAEEEVARPAPHGPAAVHDAEEAALRSAGGFRRSFEFRLALQACWRRSSPGRDRSISQKRLVQQRADCAVFARFGPGFCAGPAEEGARPAPHGDAPWTMQRKPQGSATASAARSNSHSRRQESRVGRRRFLRLTSRPSIQAQSRRLFDEPHARRRPPPSLELVAIHTPAGKSGASSCR